MTLVKEEFFAALMASGMPEIPQDFSVVPLAQLIPVTTLLEIDDFIRLFDRITTRTVWQKAVTESAPEIAQFPRSDLCMALPVTACSPVRRWARGACANC